MSRQPSTAESLRSAASEATHTVAETLDPSEDKNPSKWRQEESLDGSRRLPSQGVSYKEQLDEAATSEQKGSEEEESIVERAASCILGASTVQSVIQGKQEASTSEAKVEDVGKPPTRPENDVQVEEFLKEQYRSRSKDEDTSKPGKYKA
ncbi:hypothetical protein VE01_09967 [Pseudogymnoascus verrucosus]|uniref:Uncharacterized protein n=1 Tax=Pseudogymnoascus verrucosus TaxID=342668 RepID=A0A1B8G8R0_9PEZI|nr:uncharacterized protein VE01_09967 [Pseudogymnoascus verrucosus]OBT92214.1 hypothetical protein VE01_09967 [Pseudogymnoascus verrucosus]